MRPGRFRTFAAPFLVSFLVVSADLALLDGQALCAQSSSAQPDELRAIWLTRWDFRTRDDIARALRWCAAFGFGRVFFQVRGQADAFYHSAREPWGEELGRGGPGFDPLAVAVEEAKDAGIELHAWVNVLPAWKGRRPPQSRRHVFHRNPEWFLLDLHGKRQLTAEPGHYTILNPCLPEVRSYVTSVIEDIATRYGVDGVHLDYVRFVGRDVSRGIDFPYDPRSLSLFRSYSGESPFDAPEAWDTWRRLAVNTLLHGISQAVRQARPGCVVSVAAIQDYDRARDGLFQDVATWSRNGWVDEVFPMTYARDAHTFRRAYAGILEEDHGAAEVYPGIGVHLFSHPGELLRQLVAARSLEARGFCLFAYSSFFPSASHESASTPAAKELRGRMRDALLSYVDGAAAPRRSRAPPAPTESSAPPAPEHQIASCRLCRTSMRHSAELENELEP